MSDIQQGQKVELENKISSIIREDNNCSTHFEYQKVDKEKVEVLIITYNPIHKQKFVLKQFVTGDVEEGLADVLEYLEENRHIKNSYTVVWLKKGENKTQVSYFSGKNMMEVLQKFYHQKDKDDYIIYEIKLNPES